MIKLFKDNKLRKPLGAVVLALFIIIVILFSVPFTKIMPAIAQGEYCAQCSDFGVDVLPGNILKVIDLEAKGTVPIALMGNCSCDFCVQPKNIRFAGAVPIEWQVKDLNNDGCPDWLFYFNVQDLKLTKASTDALLVADICNGVSCQVRKAVKIQGSGVFSWLPF